MPDGTASAARTIAAVRSLGLLPVVELDEVAQAEPLFDALSAGGLPAAEITLRTPAALEAIGLLAKAYPDGLIGAGTVRSLDDAARVIDAGARFVVSPATDPELIAFCVEQDVLVLPGACTPTEVQAALRAGAELIKFFPAELSGGVAYLKALAGPFREVSFVPTGGVNAANLAEYLALPHVAACGGSWMVAPGLLRAKEFLRVEQLAAAAVSVVEQLRPAQGPGTA
jgi:2-dehydro-3-deoxyphosphogluconate aldolase/(4S)-4-hydroxy-2-oxoglutarate aldolase